MRETERPKARYIKFFEFDHLSEPDRAFIIFHLELAGLLLKQVPPGPGSAYVPRRLPREPNYVRH